MEQRLPAQRTRRLVGDQSVKIPGRNLQIICSHALARDVLLQVKFAERKGCEVRPFLFRALQEKPFEFLSRFGGLVLCERQFHGLQQCLAPACHRRARREVPFISIGRRFEFALLLEDSRAHGDGFRNEVSLARSRR